MLAHSSTGIQLPPGIRGGPANDKGACVTKLEAERPGVVTADRQPWFTRCLVPSVRQGPGASDLLASVLRLI